MGSIASSSCTQKYLPKILILYLPSRDPQPCHLSPRKKSSDKKMISLKSGPPNAEANDASPFDQSMALVSDWVDDAASPGPTQNSCSRYFPLSW
ncbi:unnamed protein product [Prunus brigantina]